MQLNENQKALLEIANDPQMANDFYAYLERIMKAQRAEPYIYAALFVAGFIAGRMI